MPSPREMRQWAKEMTMGQMTEEEMDNTPDQLDQIIEDAKASAKRIRELASASGSSKPINFPRLIGGEIIPMLIALAEELQNRDMDHDERLELLEVSLGAAGIGTGHPLAAIPAPAAVELLTKCRGLAEAFIHLESAPTPDMKAQAQGIIASIDMAFHQAQGLQEAAEAEAAEAEAAEAEAAEEGVADA
jgi:hypothetical protein